MSLVIVTPFFEDAEAAQQLFADIASACGGDTYVVAVDDGSIGEPLDPQTLSSAGLQGAVVRLKRNVGHQRAIAIGLAHAAEYLPSAAQIAVMDGDGEDRPASLAVMREQLARGNADAVVAQRKSRIESKRFKLFYFLYQQLFGLLTGRRIKFGNFMVMNRIALERLTSMGELAIHVAGTLMISRLRWESCLIDRGPRYAGSSKMNFVGLVLHGFKGLMVFAEDVLIRVGATCALVAFMSVLGITAAIVLKAIGYATPGWFSVALGILLLMFLQTGAITLMTLLLTGITRNAVSSPADHRLLIKSIVTVTARAADRSDA